MKEPQPSLETQPPPKGFVEKYAPDKGASSPEQATRALTKEQLAQQSKDVRKDRAPSPATITRDSSIAKERIELVALETEEKALEELELVAKQVYRKFDISERECRAIEQKVLEGSDLDPVSPARLHNLKKIRKALLIEQAKRGVELMQEMQIPKKLADQLVAGHRKYFPIKRLSRQGAMSQVVEMMNLENSQRVIVKFLLSDDKDAFTRFKDEAVAAANLNTLNKNIVDVIDAEFDHFDAGGAFMIQQKIEGNDTEEELREQGAFSEEEAINVGIQIANALAEMHKHGLIHRDVKPSNIIIRDEELKTPSGTKTLRRYVLADLGQVGFAESGSLLNLKGEVVARHTGKDEGMLLGTPQFMSPEQASAKATDVRTDIYSLGLTMFRLLTNDDAIKLSEADSEGSNLSQVLKIIQLVQQDEKASLLELVRSGQVKGVSEELAEFVDSMLNKNPKMRPSAEEVQVALKNFRAGALRHTKQDSQSSRQAQPTVPKHIAKAETVELPAQQSAPDPADSNAETLELPPQPAPKKKGFFAKLFGK